MNSSEKITLLGDVLTLQRGFDLPKKDRKPGLIPLVSSGGISDFQSEAKIQAPAVITGRYGTIGKVFLLNEPCFPLNTTLWVKDFKGNDPRFCKYLLETIDYYSCSDKGAVPGVNRNHLEQLQVRKPELGEQKAIAHILGTLDEKIELNIKTNKILENIVNAIFKSWFVDFDPVIAKIEGRSTGLTEEISNLFPDELTEHDANKIPKSWHVKKIEDIASKVSMGPFGSNMKISSYVSEGVPIISGAQMTGYLLIDSKNNFITEEHADKLKNSIAERGDIVITQTGTVGQVSLIPYNSKYEKYMVSSRQHFCRPISKNLSEFIFCFLSSKSGQHELLKNVVTTGVPSISRPITNLKQIEMVIPDQQILDLFSSITKNIFLKIRNNIEENDAILAIRDALLPKLISGKMQLNRVEKLLKEAGI